jgi:glucose-1-phosphate adenylyltransferase
MADQFGVIEVEDDDHTRIKAFLEKPSDPAGLPDSPDEILASMGNYVFDADVLQEAVTRDSEDPDSTHDMGGDIVPALVRQRAAYTYDFKKNVIPGGTERDKGYWRDVGTLDSYFDAHMDLISIHPIFSLYNYDWPLFTSYGPYPPAKFVHGASGRFGEALNSMVSPGVIISGARVNSSIISPDVRVHSYSEVDDSVILDAVDIGRNCRVRRAIIDKNVHLPENTSIGFDAEHDRDRGFTVTDSGITIVGKGTVLEP